jgi:hypothetical protein
MAMSTLSSVFTKASTKITSYVWTQPNQGQGNRKYTIADKNTPGYDEVERFFKQEKELDFL